MIVSTENYVEKKQEYTIHDHLEAIEYAVLLSDYCFGWHCIKAAKMYKLWYIRPSLPPQNGSVTPDGVTNHRLGTTGLVP